MLLVPAHRIEVGEVAWVHLNAVLRLVVLQDVEIRPRCLDNLEDTTRIGLLHVKFEAQRLQAVLAEADVDEPGLWCTHAQDQVVERWSENSLAVEYAGREQHDLEAE